MTTQIIIVHENKHTRTVPSDFVKVKITFCFFPVHFKEYLKYPE